MADADPFGQGVQFAALTDAPDASKLAHGLGDETAKRTVMRFASASDRAANVASPEAGMVTYLRDTKLWQAFDGSSWQTFVASTLPWANVSLASGYVPWIGSTVAPRVRREGSIVYLEGRMMRTGQASIAAQDGITIATIPAAYRPISHYAEGVVTLSNAGAGTPVGRIEVWPNDPNQDTNTWGTIRYWSDKATTWIGFSSWWFVN